MSQSDLHRWYFNTIYDYILNSIRMYFISACEQKDRPQNNCGADERLLRVVRRWVMGTWQIWFDAVLCVIFINNYTHISDLLTVNVLSSLFNEHLNTVTLIDPVKPSLTQPQLTQKITPLTKLKCFTIMMKMNKGSFRGFRSDHASKFLFLVLRQKQRLHVLAN